MEGSLSTLDPEGVWLFLTASKLLAVGSALLVPASFVALMAFALGLFFACFILLTVLGVLVQALGWYVLSEGAGRSTPTRVAFIASLAGFVAGAALFLVTEISSPGLYLLFGGWLLLPFVPMVYGPTVIAQAALFLLVAVRLRTKRSGYLVAAGSVALASIAVAGLYVQASLPPERSFPIPGLALAGLTCIGYGLIAAGFHGEYEHERTALAPLRALGGPQDEPKDERTVVP